MSLVSDFHDVVNYTGKNKAMDDTQRLCIITFKTDKKKAEKQLKDESGKLKDNPYFDPAYKKPDARCISVPKLSVSVKPEILQPAMQAALEDLQDDLIRKLLIEKLDAGDTVINFHKDQIGFDQLALYAAEVAASGKMKKELIHDWFDVAVANNLTIAIANAMKLGEKPSAEDERKLAAAVTNYKNIFGSLAAPKAGLSKTIAMQMQKALQVAEDKDDRIYRALETKIKNSLEEKEPELIGL